jgi:hypothetical protein
MPKYYRSVELLGVPSYYQGTYDSLCTYYAAAMLLTTLHPEYHDFFGRGARYQRVGLKVEDPLIRNFPGPQKDTTDRVLATWFYRGAYLSDACKALNASMKEDQHDTRFKHALYTHRDSTFQLIADDIDQGLPVMIGWTTVDYGVHCTLVVGYRKARRRWLILHDPSSVAEVCWEVLKDIDKWQLALVRVDRHDGPRPDRLTVVTNADNVNVRPTQIDRWWPHEGEVCYRPIAELYEMAKGSSFHATE